MTLSRTVVSTAFMAASIAAVGCVGDGADSEAVLSEVVQHVLVPEDLSAETREEFGPRWDVQVRRVAVRPTMALVMPSPEELGEWYVPFLSDAGIPASLVEELVEATGERTGVVERLDGVRGRVVLLSQQQEAQLDEDWRQLAPSLDSLLGGPWSAIHFPTPPVIRGDLAVAYYVSYEFPPYSGSGSIAYLTKEPEGWRVQQHQELWSEN